MGRVMRDEYDPEVSDLAYAEDLAGRRKLDSRVIAKYIRFTVHSHFLIQTLSPIELPNLADSFLYLYCEFEWNMSTLSFCISVFVGSYFVCM